MFFKNKKNNRIFYCIASALIIFLIALSIAIYAILNTANPAKILSIPVVQTGIKTVVGEETASLISDLPDFLGANETRTYLLLFLNNTELRPGGGFIGSYAVLHFENGRPNIIKVEGTETLDRLSDRSLLPAPPEPLSKYVGVDYWYFRDSNWSSDFSVSAQNALDLYAKENGARANDIDGVIGITTHVLEEVMTMTGPITVSGVTFNADNVIETLEYEVEYGYKDKGITFRERKQVLGELTHELFRRLGTDFVQHPLDYRALLKKMTEQKHLFAWSPKKELQNKFEQYGWSGIFAVTSTDYVFWVDANVAALKTDYAMERTLQYAIGKNADGNYIATTTMRYANNGTFDWRTTRYRTFARLYVPKGAKLLSVHGAMEWDRTAEQGIPVIGEELDSTVFGAFISIEPGKTGSLSFTYQFPPSVLEAIKKGDYSLSIPKQLGTVNHGLTLDLNFDTTIKNAKPAEEEKDWRDSRYSITTDLLRDRFFEVGF